MLAREGGGEEAAQRGVEFSFVWERDGGELCPGTCPGPGSPHSYSGLQTPLAAFPFLSNFLLPSSKLFPKFLSSPPTSAKQEETFLEEQEDKAELCASP